MRFLKLCLLSLFVSQTAETQICQDFFYKKSLDLQKTHQIVYSSVTHKALMDLEQRWRQLLSPDFAWSVNQGFSKYEYEAIAELIYTQMIKSAQHYSYDFEPSYGLKILLESTPRSQIIRELSYLIYGLQNSQTFPQLSDQLNVPYMSRHKVDQVMDQAELASLSSAPLFTAGVTVGAMALMLGDTPTGQTMEYVAYGLAGTGIVSAAASFLGLMGISLIEVTDPYRVSTLKRYKLKRIQKQLQRFYRFSKENFEKLPTDNLNRLDLTPLYDSMRDRPLIPQERSSGWRLPIII